MKLIKEHTSFHSALSLMAEYVENECKENGEPYTKSQKDTILYKLSDCYITNENIFKSLGEDGKFYWDNKTYNFYEVYNGILRAYTEVDDVKLSDEIILYYYDKSDLEKFVERKFNR